MLTPEQFPPPRVLSIPLCVLISISTITLEEASGGEPVTEVDETRPDICALFHGHFVLLIKAHPLSWKQVSKLGHG